MLDILARMMSWKSSLVGVFIFVNAIGAFLTAVGVAASAFIDGDAATVPDWGAVTTSAVAIGVAFKLIWQKEDSNPITGKK